MDQVEPMRRVTKNVAKGKVGNEEQGGCVHRTV